jgi:hypothetical protein
MTRALIGRLVLFSVFWCCLTQATPSQAGQLGANAIYLMANYVPRFVAPSEDAEATRFVRIQMAKKAIHDAKAAGLTFLRVDLSGSRPIGFDDKINDLAVWQQDPNRFWKAADEMFSDLDQAGIQIVPTLAWNIIQFPALGGDDVLTFLRNPDSKSRVLLKRFVTDFVTRYKNRKTILFYELTNEWNLFADINTEVGCKPDQRCIWHNFKTDDLLTFARSMVSLVKSLDPSRQISSGYSLPRTAALHLRSGAGWVADSSEQFKDDLLYISEPFDIISVHIYPPDTDRFGLPKEQPGEFISVVMSAARSVRKPVFIGEFGDSGATPFLRNFLRAIVDQHVDYAAIWSWEFYQSSTYETHNTDPSKFSIEPGYYDDLIALLTQTEQALGHPLAAKASDAPAVILTWPLPCAKLDRPINLAAVASAGAHGVKAVEFSVNGKPLATVTAPPFFAKFDPKDFGDSNLEIEAKAISDSGQSADYKTMVRANGSTAACQVPQN